jgi:hypothetical protein
MTWNHRRNRTRAQEKKEEATAGVDTSFIAAAIIAA